MRAGDLDRRITLQRANHSFDENGSQVESWVDLATVWARYRPLKASEQIVGAKRTAEADIEFWIRYSDTVKTLQPKDRIKYGDRVFDIYQVFEIGRQEGVRIQATERDHLLEVA